MLSIRTSKQCLVALSLGVSALLAGSALAEMPPDTQLNGDAASGKIVANDRAKGNCVACHVMAGAESPGSIGPVLIAMQTRFPSKQELARQIWDPTVKNPEAVMPPFGKHEILTDKEFKDVVEYIWSL
ncbi:sulfur oxidation c-type cytochrome SoxX [Thiorhodococcus mannitoliphagus]|uniref:Sulfur oxidation c-type cytochrome SoxX n=1 Tax=Thiorhodococcus mannitoliphagus TaxID=329406 RepID=A0A6P1DV62_9GAMM|nr:sulfur oxidation c-type cytochrome SoxX [Thiorhodococcus mannitoliphagus]NEX21093.1 sulfur oxidation c-type cytochrome SoxX [Thiorhodococcus mannitoliphagus]